MSSHPTPAVRARAIARRSRGDPVRTHPSTTSRTGPALAPPRPAFVRDRSRRVMAGFFARRLRPPVCHQSLTSLAHAAPGSRGPRRARGAPIAVAYDQCGDGRDASPATAPRRRAAMSSASRFPYENRRARDEMPTIRCRRATAVNAALSVPDRRALGGRCASLGIARDVPRIANRTRLRAPRVIRELRIIIFYVLQCILVRPIFAKRTEHVCIG